MPEEICANLKDELVKAVKEISSESESDMLRNRYDKFRKIGAYK